MTHDLRWSVAPRGRFALLAVILSASLLLSAACAAAEAPGVPPGDSAALPTATPAEAVLAATVTPPPARNGPLQRPLEELSAPAARLVERHGAAGVAVLVPGEDTVYVANAETPFPMASLVKVPVMLTALHQAKADARPIGEEEHELLRRMIAISDNDATSLMWERVGGGAAVAEYLRGIEVEGIGPVSGGAWGDTQATALGVVRLFHALAEGRAVDRGQQQYALELFSEVIEAHRWGVSAGVETQGADGARVLAKNGWYPAEDGWWVNSGGVVLGPDGRLRYVLAVMTKEHETHPEGIEFIEGVARAVHRELADLRR